MLEEDASLRRDPCNIVVPNRPSKMMVATTGFLSFSVDFRQDGDYFYANIGRNIGRPFTTERLLLAKAAYDGDDRPFTKSDSENTIVPGFRMGITTDGICRLRRDHNGVWIGNCDSCMTQLGYLCDGALFLRSRSTDNKGKRQLVTSLEDLRKVKANARGDVAKAVNRGIPNYFIGLSRKHSKNIETAPSLTSLKDYLKSLRVDQLLNVVVHLRLVTAEEGFKTAEQMSHMELLHACDCFIVNPSTHRENQDRRKQHLISQRTNVED